MQRDIQSASDLVLAMLSYRFAEKYQALNKAINAGSRAQMRLALTEFVEARKAYQLFTTNLPTNDSSAIVALEPQGMSKE